MKENGQKHILYVAVFSEGRLLLVWTSNGEGNSKIFVFEKVDKPYHSLERKLVTHENKRLEI